MRLVEVIRGPERPTREQLKHRRRRARALGAVALLALLLGLVVGAGSGGSSTPDVSGELTRVGWYGHLRTLSGTGEGSLDLEQRAQESAAIDRVLDRHPFIRNAGENTREIALTFDDGPSDYTDRLLDLLDRLRVPATFFVNGKHVADHPDEMQRLIDAGHTIANHSWAHPDMTTLSAADQAAQVADTSRAIQNVGGPTPRLFRPPYGAYNDTTHRVLDRAGELSVLWSVDSQDYTLPGVDGIVQNVVPNVHPGAIILMHDGGGPRDQTIAAVERIVPALRRQGYRFVTVPRLLLDNPPEAEDTRVPDDFNSANAG
jgi:peptidoglycan/xylan/chitin deacetylase (PgdA/CDA1 family)